MNSATWPKRDRRSGRRASPMEEDRGLFKGELCQLQVELTGHISKNRRSDVLVAGFIEGGAQVTIAFAGRRRALFGPLNTRLNRVQSRHAKSVRGRTGADGDIRAETEGVRVPVLVEGCWRVTFRLDRDGFQSQRREFVAARWVYASDNGDFKSYGFRPEQSGA